MIYRTLVSTFIGYKVVPSARGVCLGCHWMLLVGTSLRDAPKACCKKMSRRMSKYSLALTAQPDITVCLWLPDILKLNAGPSQL